MKQSHWRSAFAETVAGIRMLQEIAYDASHELPEIETFSDIVTFRKIAELDKVEPGKTEGAWVVTDLESGEGRCSVCTEVGYMSPFCPSCGAKMGLAPITLKEFCHMVADNLGRAGN